MYPPYFFLACLLLHPRAQIGWVDKHFTPSPSPATDDVDEGEGSGSGENGVGDDTHSWAYDGFRQMCWNEVQAAYPKIKKGKRKGAHDGSGIWKAGDTVGCLLEVNEVESEVDVKAAKGKKKDTKMKTQEKEKEKEKEKENEVTAHLSFQLNGCDLGVAFDSHTSESLRASVKEAWGVAGATDRALALLPAVSLEEEQSAAVNIGQRPFKYNNFPDAVSVFSVLQLSDTSKSKATTASGKSKNSGLTNCNNTDDIELCTPIDLEVISSPADLEAKGLSHLKAELERRGLKAGGTLEQRAARLFMVRGLQEGDIPHKLKAKPPK